MWRGWAERSNQSGVDGRGTQSLFLEKNLCHYSVATGLWFTAAYSPYSSTGPWSPCRLNVEQHHDWDATSLHSPPLQQLWLTDQHTLFNPRKRAPRLSWKPMFLWILLLCCWWALIIKLYLWNISDCRHCHYIACQPNVGTGPEHVYVTFQ